MLNKDLSRSSVKSPVGARLGSTRGSSFRGCAVSSSKTLSRRSSRATNSEVRAIVEKPLFSETARQEQNVERFVGNSVAAIVLGGGAGTRLYPLTKSRAKPAVSIGGAYRLVDIPISNCINSGVNKIFVLTQFNSTSLNRHVGRTYNRGVTFSGKRNAGFVEVLAASLSPSSQKEWFQGTADAVRQYGWMLEDVRNRKIEHVLILSGDHLYRMNYMAFVQEHLENNADITIATIPCGYDRASDFGLMKVDENSSVIEFAEKPKGDALENMRVDTTSLGLDKARAEDMPFIASMGVYCFKKDVLLNLLNKEFMDANDFGSEIIPGAKNLGCSLKAHLFDGYWEDIGTVRSFFDANLNLAKEGCEFEFYDPEAPIYTSPRGLEPSKLLDCKISESIISHGCKLEKSTIQNAVVGLRSIVSSGCTIKDAMIMGADKYESPEEVAAKLANGGVPIGIGENCLISNTIVDKNARIGKNCTIVNKDGAEEKMCEEEGYIIRSGIVVIMRGATIPDGTVI